MKRLKKPYCIVPSTRSLALFWPSTRRLDCVDSSTHRLVDSIHPQIFFTFMIYYESTPLNHAVDSVTLFLCVSLTRLYLGKIHCIDSLTHRSIDSTSRYH